MSRIRTLILAALLLALVVPVVSSAQPAPVFPLPFTRLIQTVTVIAPGDTESEAVDNAIAMLEEDYRILSYTVLNSFCTTDDPPGPVGPITLCAAEVEARVIRKLTIVSTH